MKSDRFVLKVVLLAGAVGLASFVAALQVLDDGQPDPPPSAGSSVDDTTSSSIASASTSSSTTSATTAELVSGEIATPAWVAIIASAKDRAEADEAAAAAAAKSHPAGVLRSDDYDSLSKGLWVGYVGPYNTSAKAQAVIESLKADGWDSAYVRCVGQKEECEGAED